MFVQELMQASAIRNYARDQPKGLRVTNQLTKMWVQCWLSAGEVDLLNARIPECLDQSQRLSFLELTGDISEGGEAEGALRIAGAQQVEVNGR